MIENNNNTPFHSLVVGSDDSEALKSKLVKQIMQMLSEMHVVFVYRNAHPNIYKITVHNHKLYAF